MTITQVMHALDNSTPYPVELNSQVLRFMAERMLEMTEMRKRPDHEVWQPDEGTDAASVVEPMDPDALQLW
ncbi:hypothetical protein ACFW2V_13275 [Streptomyces sp. NPDC058947]|uniref:hypothetical protein n=1 Tax=Streptomyces sp. NPDC058947 TaxID=3346675 RepID=UPI003673B173